MPRGGKRGGRGGGGRGRRGGGGGGQRNFQDNRVSFENVDKRNENFENYYNTIGIVPDGEEREAFWKALRKELPNSFRFTGSKGHALSVRDNLVNRFFPLLEKIKHEGRPVDLPKPMPWYPNGLAYSMTTPKNVVRKYEPFKEFQKFLVSETGVGNISRQEEVSMIPPLLLDVEPHHTVLDLCAAPGSKSAQLVELLHAGEEERVSRSIQQANGKLTLGEGESVQPDSGRSTGILVANDVNYQRAQMLVHQVKRLNSPNLIVTNHDATMFPSIATSQEILPNGQKKGGWLKFDRILADVPCSGDGTCRKNPSIWKEWTPQNGLGLYITQVRILTRALQMLKVGGRVVYSTCSLNPVENEAVISSAIERCGGVSKVRLCDSSDRLPGLHRKPGLKDWSIMSRSGTIYESWAEASQFEQEGSKIVPGMFPPEEAEEIPLQNCIRVYPHQQDTGGFFIAALEKLGEIRAKAEPDTKSGSRDWTFVKPQIPEKTMFTETNEKITNGVVAKPKAATQQWRRRNADANEEAFKFLSPEHPELVGIYSFYDLHSSFPRDRFLVRNPAGDPVKGIYYVAKLIKDILISNENRGMKFVHAGVKMFMKQDVQGQDICRWRIQAEGLPIIEGWVGESRVIRLRKKRTLRKLLVEMFPKVATTQHEDGTETGGWKDLGEIGEQVNSIGGGCCVLRVEATPDAGTDEFKEPLTLPLWRSKASVNLMLPKEDRRAMLLRIYNEDVELINHSDPKQNGGREFKREAKEARGSVSGQAEVEQVQHKTEDAGNEQDATPGAGDQVVDQANGLSTTDADAMSLEADMVAAEDSVQSKRREAVEDEDGK
ncbi:uncharacterized protein MYCFIDRAFT_154036 [Pseudocercospora fijiensis CIRAD86]|uniref:SAM-dependent MTase RsmB/NOP-type domain-containing protein n=1 Tax=Pseudocercospora fijiensis (strain CIRAD86) TaxID=383855 RepID=M2Z0S1_PSEFD|nr:uncharacterized protein MYCFIDRAFT_154036 [Pseudocercospora fijiensis CIRAD86]EME83440.1 hypothetical protein MYCFIDRAFT_154036 [Pseudocercospora fijiensis CIRAD86]